MKSLLSIELPKGYGEKIQTGIPAFDEMFGTDQGDYGFVTGKTYLISAPAGTGKSRLALTIMDHITKHDPDVVTGHFTGEQNEFALRKMVNDMGIIPNENLLVAKEDRWENIKRAVIDNNISFLVIDSLPMIINDFPMKTDEVTLKRVPMSLKEKMKAISDFAAEYGLVMVLINHTTKGGSWKGSTDIIHLVDVAITMKANDKDYEGVKVVEFYGGKNREGVPVNRAFPFNGVWDLEAPFEVASNTGAEGGGMNAGKVAERKEMHRMMIKEAFANLGGRVSRNQIDSEEFTITGMVKSGILTALRSMVDDGILSAVREHVAGKKGQPPIVEWTLNEVAE